MVTDEGELPEKLVVRRHVAFALMHLDFHGCLTVRGRAEHLQKNTNQLQSPYGIKHFPRELTDEIDASMFIQLSPGFSWSELWYYV